MKRPTAVSTSREASCKRTVLPSDVKVTPVRAEHEVNDLWSPSVLVRRAMSVHEYA